MARSSRNRKQRIPRTVDRVGSSRRGNGRVNPPRVAGSPATHQIERETTQRFLDLESQLTELLEIDDALTVKSPSLVDQHAESQAELAATKIQCAEAQDELDQCADQQLSLSKTLQRAGADLEQMLRRLSTEQESLARQRSEFEEIRKTWSSRKSQLDALEQELSKRSAEIESESQQLLEASDAIDRKAASTAKQRRLIATQLRARRAEQSIGVDACDPTLQRVREDLEVERATRQNFEAELQSNRETLQNLDAELNSECEARKQIEARRSAELQKLRSVESQLEEECTARQAVEAELSAARNALECVKHESAALGDASDDTELDLRNELNNIRSEFEATTKQLAELEIQNRDLASQLAAQQVLVAGSAGQVALESMTWEQRKSHMLEQLVAEDNGELVPDNKERHLKITDVIQRTDRELQKRDEEIGELRCLLEQQSTATGDVAIGGAAILQMLDQDEMIVEERAKLQRIQTEWEEKLRQAEIDVSLERAKLARERIDIEQRMADVREATKIESKSEPKGRKWLAQLGLADSE